mmetsp:Transcript_90557/g.174332  ORF Transcript_90557/g.174332 Transcript_90557/m.174332 type:complete len:203 (-) Transcript_90557:446-1054(-)
MSRAVISPRSNASSPGAVLISAQGPAVVPAFLAERARTRSRRRPPEGKPNTNAWQEFFFHLLELPVLPVGRELSPTSTHSTEYSTGTIMSSYRAGHRTSRDSWKAWTNSRFPQPCWTQESSCAKPVRLGLRLGFAKDPVLLLCGGSTGSCGFERTCEWWCVSGVAGGIVAVVPGVAFVRSGVQLIASVPSVPVPTLCLQASL